MSGMKMDTLAVQAALEAVSRSIEASGQTLIEWRDLLGESYGPTGLDGDTGQTVDWRLVDSLMSRWSDDLNDIEVALSEVYKVIRAPEPEEAP